MRNILKTVIKEYFDQISRKNLAIAFLVERVHMLSAQRDDLSKEVMELRRKLRSMKHD